MRRKESDGRVVPEGRRKAVPTTAGAWGGKATTASEWAKQLVLFAETADSPRGAVPDARTGSPETDAQYAVPKSADASNCSMPAMTMEEVASDANLRRAFEQVKRNDGAPGPDRQDVFEVEAHLDTLLPGLRQSLVEGTFAPGRIRRVWIPKPGGGERGLGIPNVVDRIVQQAVHQVLGPQYEKGFHASSHGFRPGRSCHTAIAEARRHLKDGYEWVVDLDLEKFFDRVNHDRLMARMARQVVDKLSPAEPRGTTCTGITGDQGTTRRSSLRVGGGRPPSEHSERGALERFVATALIAG